MLTTPPDALRTRAAALVAGLAAGRRMPDVRVDDSEATVGGGAFPTARIPSVALSFGGDAASLEARLRGGEPPVIGRVADGRLLVDLRTILPREDEVLARALGAALGG
jgi:L-seryl-tRNA(Ser) seleniumtransferase